MPPNLPESPTSPALPFRLDPLVETAKAYAPATSAHTNRAYAADWRDYLGWRTRRNLKARPLADAETVGLYLGALGLRRWARREAALRRHR